MGRNSRSERGTGFKLGRLAGVQVRVDWSLLVIFWLITANLGAGLLPARHPEWSGLLTWGVALAAAVLFFASVLAHEMAHALVGRAFGIPIDSITLFIFGGMANMQREPSSPRGELLMAAVGPIVSIVLGVAFLLMAELTAGSPEPGESALEFLARLGPASALLMWLGPINIILGVFNLVPGFPLDGGRVLRAALWAGTKDFRRATLWATSVGRVVAGLLIAAGIAMMLGVRVPILGSGLVSGLWLSFIGWFLNNAALASYQQVVVRGLLEEVPVGRLMRREPVVVPPETTVASLVDDYIMRTDQRAFPVAEGPHLLGLVCLQDVRKIDHHLWWDTPVTRIMTPTSELAVVDPSDDGAEALQKLTSRDVDQVPVVEGDTLVGMVRRSDLMKWIEIQAEEAAGRR